MEPSSNPAALVRRHLRRLVDNLSEELDIKLGSEERNEESKKIEIENCFLKLKDKVERLRIADNQFLTSLSSSSLEDIDVEKELEDSDVYQEKWIFIKTKYDKYMGEQKQAEADATDKSGKTTKKPFEEVPKFENKDWSQNPSRLEYPALGTNGHVGQLYDARTNKFFSKTLFTTKALPSIFIQTDELRDTKIKIEKNDQISDRFQLLDVKAEQQLSLLGLPFKLSRHGEYLLHEKKSLRSSASTLLYRYSSKRESLVAPVEEIRSIIDKDVFQYAKYTHVVVGIIWGAICTLTLELYNEDVNEKENVEASLKNKLDYLRLLIESRTEGRINDNDSFDKSTNLILKIFSDIPYEQNVDSIKKASAFILQIPGHIETGREAFPLTYILVDRTAFTDILGIAILSKTLIPIDKSCIVLIVCFFETLAVLKQKLYDFERDYYRYEFYVANSYLQEISSFQKSLSKIEAAMKADLCKMIPQIRSGEVEMQKLLSLIEACQGPNSDLTNISSSVKDFKLYGDIALIDQCSLSNIIYLKKNEKLSDVIQKENCESYVLFTCAKLFEADSSLSEKTFNEFWAMAEKAEKNGLYILADLDINKTIPHENGLKIFHYRNGEIVSKDVLADIEKERSRNYVRLRSFTGFTKTNYKPIERTILKLVCPGVLIGTCRNEPLVWHCYACKEVLEYGFDDHFYCDCGKGPNVSFEFKCSFAIHGDKFIPLSRRFPLRKELSKLQPFEEMNILILGQSGVGKSTWINSIANYFQYKTLEEARKGGVICAIPASFSVLYTTHEKVVKERVTVGNDDPNETTDVGKSATKDPKTYNFIYNNRAVRLIDTPGLGDKNGYEQGKENMRKIVDIIGFLKEIHGICILLKSNEIKFDVTFRFCINELLTHLHRNAARNIIFCFTHSRSAFYSSGDTSTVLENLLKNLGLSTLISLNKKTTFCLDNEAFRYLCSLQYKNISWTAEDEKIYKESWTKSVEETRRLFGRIEELKPHIVADTTIICHARNRILNLMKPMVEITQAIQSNLVAIKIEEKKISENNESLEKLEKLAKKLRMPQIMLEPEPLPFPRTVCTSPKCVKYVHLEHSNITMVEYTTICHEHCSLPNVISEVYPNEALRTCHIFNYDPIRREKCGICGCRWDSHMHIAYIQKRVEEYVNDPNIEDEINSKKDAAAKIEEHKRHLVLKTEEYKHEKNTITQTCLKFAAFLRENCITPYNDAFKEYLKYLIKLETDRANKTEVDNNIIQNLKDTMRDYEELVKIMDESLKNKNFENVSAQDIEKSIQVSMASKSPSLRSALVNKLIRKYEGKEH